MNTEQYKLLKVKNGCKREFFFSFKRALLHYRTTSSNLMYTYRSPCRKVERREHKGKNCRNRGQKLSSFDENYKPRSAVKFKHKKCGENCTKHIKSNP